MVQNVNNNRAEGLGPAERIIQTLLRPADHMVHNRPGMVTPDATLPHGKRWEYGSHKVEDGKRVFYKHVKVGKKTRKDRVGEIWKDNTIRDANRRKIADYQPAGIFPAVAEWMYRQALQVWQLNAEFAARWASYAFKGEHKDLKVVLAALMLVQSHKGDPELEDGKVVFFNDDFRAVGEAMCLVSGKGVKHLDAKQLLRIRDLLSLPEIAAINRELGFGRSTRRPFLGRWPKAVERWLRYREDNPKILEGLVKSGQKEMIKRLAQHIGYKPQSPAFFAVLRWRQDQAKQGHRDMLIGVKVAEAETWAGMSEQDICERIMKEKPGYKRLTSLVSTGITRAIMAAAVEAGCLSDKDLIIAIPTLEELGLHKVKPIWEKAMTAARKAEDMRAMNIAKNVKSKEAKGLLTEAADTAVQKAVAEQMSDIVLILLVDVSSSMHGAIEEAKRHLEKFVQAFPLSRLHIATFTTKGFPLTLKATSERDGEKYASGASVKAAFRQVSAGGSTDYGSGVRAFNGLKVEPGQDVVMFFVGDEEANNFARAVRESGLDPVAFGLVRMGNSRYRCVQNTAVELGIPCFMVDKRTFEDVYAIPRTFHNLIAATPVGQTNARVAAPRVTLVDQILKTDLLQKPVWAAA